MTAPVNEIQDDDASFPEATNTPSAAIATASRPMSVIAFVILLTLIWNGGLVWLLWRILAFV